MKKISIVTIVTIILYFLSAASFLITKTDVALTLWELFTVIGAIVYLVFLFV